MIRVPEEIDGLELIASVSGGKDSTALILALREAGLPFRAVFADTGWEAPDTYDYLDLLRDRLGIAIDVVGVPGGMRAKVSANASFPGRMRRWCTRELKIDPLRAYHDAVGGDTVNVIGVRASESATRAILPELSDEPVADGSWGGWVWRPLIAWSVAEVLGMHTRHGIPVNPLYQMGFDRVGCMPCVMETKSSIALIADRFPDRIDEIEKMEAANQRTREARNVETPGRYAHADAPFFQVREGAGRKTIRDVVEWSRTSRGGRQLPLFAPAPTGGCVRWGLCDSLPVDEPKP